VDTRQRAGVAAFRAEDCEEENPWAIRTEDEQKNAAVLFRTVVASPVGDRVVVRRTDDVRTVAEGIHSVGAPDAKDRHSPLPAGGDDTTSTAAAAAVVVVAYDVVRILF